MKEKSTAHSYCNGTRIFHTKLRAESCMNFYSNKYGGTYKVYKCSYCAMYHLKTIKPGFLPDGKEYFYRS